MSRVQIVLTGFTLSILLLVISCSPGEKPLEKPARPEVSNQQTKTFEKSTWEQEWDKAVSEAKKESNLVILMGAGIPNSTRQEFTNEMKSRYSLALEIISGRGSELAERAIREAKAGLDRSDLFISGPTTIVISVKPEGILQPVEPFLILPEVTDPKVWFEEKIPYNDKEKMVLAFSAYVQPGLTYNADYVSKGELQSYRDLLVPKFKGKIVMNDPTVGGAGNQWFSTVGLRVMGTDYLKELVRQEVVLTRDLRQLVDGLARGKYYIGIGAGGVLLDMQRAGVPLYELSPKEGGFFTSGWGNLAVFKKAPHPNAARVYANWLLGKEGQTIFAKGVDQQSARIDVPTDFLSQSTVRQPGTKNFDTRTEQFAFETLKDDVIARDIFNLR